MVFYLVFSSWSLISSFPRLGLWALTPSAIEQPHRTASLKVLTQRELWLKVAVFLFHSILQSLEPFFISISEMLLILFSVFLQQDVDSTNKRPWLWKLAQQPGDWFWPSGPTVWKERSDSHNLSSDFHTPFSLEPCPFLLAHKTGFLLPQKC